MFTVISNKSDIVSLVLSKISSQEIQKVKHPSLTSPSVIDIPENSNFSFTCLRFQLRRSFLELQNTNKKLNCKFGRKKNHVSLEYQ